jgi:hypothetical protein
MELLNKMKNMPGLENMQKMFAQMGIPGLGKGGKINMNAMEAQMNRNMNAAKMKERMREKVQQKAQQREQQQQQQTQQNQEQQPSNCLTDEEIIKVFSTGEKVERTPRGAKPIQKEESTGVSVKNKQKNKKKK